MSQRFYKGRTDNHLSWVMVDATDFATPESALSAAMKIKIYGKLRADNTVYFVSSGTGSLTNDIKHVGASVLGIYTIGLVKADLSDASSAWYDQYIISLSATGAAYQTLVVEGVIDDSNLSAVVSDIYSALLIAQSAASDAASAAAQANSRVLVVQSQASDAYSAIIAPLASMTSDVASAVWAHAVGTRVDSRVLVNKSAISDAYSMLSDFLSDFQSRVPKRVATDSQLSDLHSDLRSFLVVMSGVQSDLYSLASDLQSDFQSRVPKRVATDSQLSDLASDIKSAVTIVQSMASDAASAAAQANSRVLLNQSRISDMQSYLVVMSGVQSDVYSGVQVLQSAFVGHTGSTASQVANASTLEIDGIDHDDQFNGYFVKLLGGSQVDELRLIVDTDKTASTIVVKPAFLSRVASGVDFVIVAGAPYLSQIHSDLKSGVTGLSALVSDVDSALSSQFAAMSDAVSNVMSAVLLTQSMASDAASAAAQANSRVLVVQSMASDAASAAAQGNSRALVAQSFLSDIRSHVSDLQSDFQSRVPKRVATDSQLSDLSSDVKSAVAAITVTISASDVSDIASAVLAGLTGLSASDISNIASAVWAEKYHAHSLASSFGSLFSVAATNAAAGASRVLLVQSRLSDFDSRLVSDVSDIRSMLSDMASDFQSRVPKKVATDSQLSDLASDLKSAITGITVSVSASDISDIASAVRATVASDLSDILSAAQQVNSRALVAQSYLSDIRSHVSDFQSDFQSRVPKRVATDSQLSDLASDLKSAVGGITVTIGASDMSDIASRVWAEAPATALTSRVLLAKSSLSDIYSLLSDVQSDVASHLGAIQAKTDKLTFDADNALDANVQKINDTDLTGDGTVGTPWGPA